MVMKALPLYVMLRTTSNDLTRSCSSVCRHLFMANLLWAVAGMVVPTSLTFDEQAATDMHPGMFMHKLN